jgi:hypothetical protein
MPSLLLLVIPPRSMNRRHCGDRVPVRLHSGVEVP